METSMRKRVIGVVVAVVLVLVTAVMPVPEGTTREGILSLGVFGGALALWICNSMPMSVSAFGMMALMPLLSVMTLNDVFLQFGGTAFFFAIATFAVSIALENTTIPLRICHALTSRTKSNPSALVIAMMFACGIVSAFLSNLATCIVFLSIAHGLLEANNTKPGESNLGRCLMIGLPAASGIGGLMTPAGTPGNALIIGLLQSEAGIDITFLQWIGLFAPIGLFTILVASVWITRVFKPEKVSDEAIADLESRLAEAGNKLTPIEKRTLAIIAIMIVCWLAGTWVPAMNVTIVAIFGMVAMFLPGIGVLEWKDTASRINWDLSFTIGSVGVLIGAMSTTGIMTWIVESLLSGIGGMNIILAFFIIGLVVCVIRAFIPTAPAIVALFGPPLLALGPIIGATPMAILYLPAMWACCPMLLWIEPIYLFSYGWGYYKPLDVLKFGAVPSFICVVVMSFVPMYCALFGL
ncbi:MAG: anion permease [Eggerthellaceae bacterium]|nr:anion permease [Eggerthellaceae bacterium]